MKALAMTLAALLSGCATTQLITERHQPTRGGIYAIPRNVMFPWHARWVKEDEQAIIRHVCGGAGARVDFSQTMRDQDGVPQTFTQFTCADDKKPGA